MIAACGFTQRRPHLFVCAEDRSIVDLRNPALHSRLVDRRIDQSLRRTKSRPRRSSPFASARTDTLLAKGFQNRLPVRLVLIAGDQSRSLVVQAFGRLLNQQLRVVFRPLAVDHFQHEFMFGIQRDMIPIVAATSVSRILRVALFLLFSHEVPLLVELDFVGVWGKKRPVRREVFPRACRQVWCND